MGGCWVWEGERAPVCMHPHAWCTQPATFTDPPPFPLCASSPIPDLTSPPQEQPDGAALYEAWRSERRVVLEDAVKLHLLPLLEAEARRLMKAKVRACVLCVCGWGSWGF